MTEVISKIGVYILKNDDLTCQEKYKHHQSHWGKPAAVWESFENDRDTIQKMILDQCDTWLEYVTTLTVCFSFSCFLVYFFSYLVCSCSLLYNILTLFFPLSLSPSLSLSLFIFV